MRVLAESEVEAEEMVEADAEKSIFTVAVNTFVPLAALIRNPRT